MVSVSRKMFLDLVSSSARSDLYIHTLRHPSAAAGGLVPGIVQASGIGESRVTAVQGRISPQTAGGRAVRVSFSPSPAPRGSSDHPILTPTR